MALATQLNNFPTNKLAIAAMIGPAVTEAWGSVMAEMYAPMSGPAMAMLAGAIASLIIGWFVPDRPNVVPE